MRPLQDASPMKLLQAFGEVSLAPLRRSGSQIEPWDVRAHNLDLWGQYGPISPVCANRELKESLLLYGGLGILAAICLFW